MTTGDESELLEPSGDDEPALGATTAMNQEHAWRANVDAWGSCDEANLRSAGRATVAAIPKWRCAAMTTTASMMTSGRKITTSSEEDGR